MRDALDAKAVVLQQVAKRAAEARHVIAEQDTHSGLSSEALGVVFRRQVDVAAFGHHFDRSREDAGNRTFELSLVCEDVGRSPVEFFEEQEVSLLDQRAVLR